MKMVKAKITKEVSGFTYETKTYKPGDTLTLPESQFVPYFMTKLETIEEEKPKVEKEKPKVEEKKVEESIPETKPTITMTEETTISGGPAEKASPKIRPRRRKD